MRLRFIVPFFFVALGAANACSDSDPEPVRHEEPPVPDAGVDVQVDVTDAAADAEAGEACPVLTPKGFGPFSVEWASALKGDFVVDVLPDASGNVVALIEDWRYTKLTVAKLDPSGAPLWSHVVSVEGGQDVDARGLALDPAGDVVMGLFANAPAKLDGAPINGTAKKQDGSFVLRFDALGGHTWTLQHEGALRDLIVDANGDIWITGEFGGTVDFGGGPISTTRDKDDQDIFLVQLSPTGAHISSRGFGGGSWWDLPRALAAKPGGGLVMVGYLGEAKETATLGGEAVSTYGPFIASYSSTGVYEWSLLPETTDSHNYWNTLDDVAVDSAGNVIVVGRSSASETEWKLDFGGGVLPGVQGALLVKLQANKSHVFSKVFQGARFQRVAVDGKGAIMAVGRLDDPADLGGGTLDDSATSGGGSAALFARFDGTGQHVSSHYFGGGCHLYANEFGLLDSEAYSVGVDSTGTPFVGASVAGNVDFGKGPTNWPTHVGLVLKVAR